ncbi:MAG: hypothetical protein IJQ40_01895 [Bacilli bacterium]|nr:hypothetical protein [Bacilli bacterium]
MKLRKIVTSSFMVLLLSSCAKELRSDIKEFVASFSLSESMSTYKHAGYTSVKISEVDGVKTEENISLSFNTLDEENLTYSFTKKTKINDGEENIFQKFLTKNDGKYFLNETDKEPVEYSIDQINLLVQEFFYKNVMYEGTYHCNGMYYGDLILETIQELQGFVEINQEKEWYIFSHKTSGKVDGKDSSVEQYYSVNKLGMLVQNISKQSYGSNYINQEINVFTL